jgi:signal transduction histidine kinase
MRSLSLKLVLAFLLTSLVGAALAALFVRQFVVDQFDAYVVEQQRAILANDVQEYYSANGSLLGIGRSLYDRAQRRQPRDSAGGYNAGAPPIRDEPPLFFGLADPAGVALTPFQSYRPGAQLPASALEGATEVRASDGTLIALMLSPTQSAQRNPAEERYLSNTDRALAIAAAIAAGIALLLGGLLAQLITRPLREMSAATRKIAAGDLSQRIVVRSRDELGELAGQFNQMSADLARANQLRRQMTADIAHDLRTPLTVIAGYLESLRDQVLKPTPERFTMLYSETQVLQRLVEDLHTLSLADTGELTLQRHPIAPGQLLERIAESYQHAALQGRLTIEASAPPDLPLINVDQDRMARALGNLMSNALRYTPAGGRIYLSAHATAAAVELVVADTGSGIAAEHLANIFERSYRVDAARQQATGGSGLGLAIVRSIIEAHGGTIGVESALSVGTRFTISLPLSS